MLAVKIRQIIGLCFILCLAGCASKTTTLRHSPNYQASLKEHPEILVLPPTAEVHRVGVGNQKERLENYESHLESLLAKELCLILRSKGFQAETFSKALIHKQQLGGPLFHLHQRYKEARETLYKPLAWKEEPAYAIHQPLGLAAINFGKKIPQSVLLFADYVGTTKTNGARALSFVGGFFFDRKELENADNAVLVVGLVDAKTGDLIWTNLETDHRNLLYSSLDNLSAQDKVDQKKIRILAERTLAPLLSKL